MGVQNSVGWPSASPARIDFVPFYRFPILQMRRLDSKITVKTTGTVIVVVRPHHHRLTIGTILYLMRWWTQPLCFIESGAASSGGSVLNALGLVSFCR